MHMRHLATVLLTSACTILTLSPAVAMQRELFVDADRAPPSGHVSVPRDELRGEVPMDRIVVGDPDTNVEWGFDGRSRMTYDLPPDDLSQTAKDMVWPYRHTLDVLGAEFMEHGDLMYLQSSSFPNLRHVLLPSDPAMVVTSLFGVEATGFQRNPALGPLDNNLVPFFLPVSAFEVLANPEYLEAFGARTWVVIQEHDLQNRALLGAFFSSADRIRSLSLFMDVPDATDLMRELVHLPLDLRRLHARTGFFSPRTRWFPELTYLNLRAPQIDRPLEWELPDERPLALVDLSVAHAYRIQAPQTLAFFIRSLLAAPRAEVYSWAADGQLSPLPQLEPLVSDLIIHRKALERGEGNPDEHRGALQQIEAGLHRFLDACQDPAAFEQMILEGLTPAGRLARQGIQDGTLQVLKDLTPVDYVIIGRDVLERPVKIDLPANPDDAATTLSALDHFSFRVRVPKDGGEEIQVMNICVPAPAYNTPVFHKALQKSPLKARVKRLLPLTVASPVSPALQALRAELSPPAQRIFDARQTAPGIRILGTERDGEILKLAQVPFAALKHVIFPANPEHTRVLLQTLPVNSFLTTYYRNKGAVFWIPPQAATSETLDVVAARPDSERIFIVAEKEEDVQHLANLPRRDSERPPVRVRVKLNTSDNIMAVWDVLRSNALKIGSLSIMTPFFDWGNATLAEVEDLRLFVPRTETGMTELMEPAVPLTHLRKFHVRYMEQDMALPTIRFFLQTILKTPNVVDDSLNLAEGREGPELFNLNNALQRLSEARRALWQATENGEEISEDLTGELADTQEIVADFLGDAMRATSFGEFFETTERDGEEGDDEGDDDSQMYDAVETPHASDVRMTYRHIRDLGPAFGVSGIEPINPFIEALPASSRPQNGGSMVDARRIEVYRMCEEIFGLGLIGQPSLAQQAERQRWLSIANEHARREASIHEKAQEFFPKRQTPVESDSGAIIRTWGDIYADAENHADLKKAMMDLPAIQWVLQRQNELRTTPGADGVIMADDVALAQAEAEYTLSWMAGRGRPPIAQIYDQIFIEQESTQNLSQGEVTEMCHATWREAARRYVAKQLTEDAVARVQASETQMREAEAARVKALHDAETARLQEIERRVEVKFQEVLQERQTTAEEMGEFVDVIKRQLREEIQESMERRERAMAEYKARVDEVAKLRQAKVVELERLGLAYEDAQMQALFAYDDPQPPEMME